MAEQKAEHSPKLLPGILVGPVACAGLLEGPVALVGWSFPVCFRTVEDASDCFCPGFLKTQSLFKFTWKARLLSPATTALCAIEPEPGPGLLSPGGFGSLKTYAKVLRGLVAFAGWSYANGCLAI